MRSLDPIGSRSIRSLKETNKRFPHESESPRSAKPTAKKRPFIDVKTWLPGTQRASFNVFYTDWRLFHLGELAKQSPNVLFATKSVFPKSRNWLWLRSAAKSESHFSGDEIRKPIHQISEGKKNLKTQVEPDNWLVPNRLLVKWKPNHQTQGKKRPENVSRTGQLAGSEPNHQTN